MQSGALPWMIMLVAVLLTLAILAFEIWTASLARTHQIDETRAKLGNMASLIAQHAERSIEAADIVLRTVQDHVESVGLAGLKRASMESFLSRRAAELTQVAEFDIVGADGTLLLSSAPDLSEVEWPARESFAYHRDHPNAGLHVGKPVTGLKRGRSLFLASRALHGPDGHFTGVVVAALHSQFFQDFYDGLETGRDGLVLLALDDGTMLLSHPAPAATLAAAVGDPARAGQLPPLPWTAPGSTAEIKDAARRIVLTRLLNANMIVGAGLSEEEDLADWRRQTLDEATTLGAILTALLGSGLYLFVQIRRRARAEREAAQANAVKARLLAAMSHEIGTPLSGLIGLLGLLRGEDLGRGQREKIEMACRSADMLMEVVGNILDLAKLESGTVELNAAPFALPHLVADALQTVEASAAAKGLLLRSEIGADVDEWHVGDAAKLRQVLINLLANAVKFTDKGGVLLRIGQQPDAPGALEFAILDTGIGIASDRIPHLLSPFAQADATIAHRFGGTGLGLAISRELIEMMGGSIAIESTLGHGSLVRFALTLPATAAPLAGEQAETSAPPEPVAAPLAGKRILLVEDDPISRWTAVALLTHWGGQVEAVEDATSGLAMAATMRYDLILMDVHLPELDGLEAARRIRASGGPNQRTPILALTADAFADEIAACRAAGFDGHLTKPLRREALVQRLIDWMTRERAATTKREMIAGEDN